MELRRSSFGRRISAMQRFLVLYRATLYMWFVSIDREARRRLVGSAGVGGIGSRLPRTYHTGDRMWLVRDRLNWTVVNQIQQ